MVSGRLQPGRAGGPSRATGKEDPRTRPCPPTSQPDQPRLPSRPARLQASGGLGGPRPPPKAVPPGSRRPVRACLGGGLGGGLGGEGAEGASGATAQRPCR